MSIEPSIKWESYVYLSYLGDEKYNKYTIGLESYNTSHDFEKDEFDVEIRVDKTRNKDLINNLFSTINKSNRRFKITIKEEAYDKK